ncbi:hypothetical protein V5O48_002279 [Marasmius crinis-equi]|uniref:Uncharacterized protein n=1 Tax=Marasmius crinis-equi TaxID=585013 RepID=A0ABR3FW23_9AGAR
MTLQARPMHPDEFSVAEQILNDPNSWRRESGRDWASDRSSDDDVTPGAGPSGGLRTGKRKPRPPSFTLKPFNKKFNLLPVNEASPNPPSNVSTPMSMHKSPLPPNSAPESPFDIEKVYGLDLDDIYGDGEDAELPLVLSQAGWSGVADEEGFDRTKALARLLESSKSITAEMTELVEQRLSILLGQGNIFRAFATPEDLEFELEGITPATGIATGSFVVSSPPSTSSTQSNLLAAKRSPPLALRDNAPFHTTTTVITVKTPSTSSTSSTPSPVSVTILSAVSASSAYSILDFYGTPKRSPAPSSRLSNSQSQVPKTSHPATTTFSTSTQLPSAPRSAVAATFSLTKIKTNIPLLPKDSPRIIELADGPESTLGQKPPKLSIVTTVPSRLAYKQKAMNKEVAPLTVSKKGRSAVNGQASPRPLPRLPRSLTPPPAVPPLPATLTSAPVPPVPELPTGMTTKSVSSVSQVADPSSRSRIPVRKQLAQAKRARSPPRKPSKEPLPPLPQKVTDEAPVRPDSETDGNSLEAQAGEAPVPRQGEKDLGSKTGGEEEEQGIDTRQSRSETRTKAGKLRSVTPPPRGSRPQKRKPGVSPVPPLPSAVISPLPPMPSSNKEVTSPSGDVVVVTPSDPSSTSSPLPAGQPLSGLTPASSSGSFPSPSMFPLPPAFVQPSTQQAEVLASSEVIPTVTERESITVGSKMEGDDRNAHKLSMDNLIKLLDGGRKHTAPATEPPVIQVSAVAEKDGLSIPGEVVPSDAHVEDTLTQSSQSSGEAVSPKKGTASDQERKLCLRRVLLTSWNKATYTKGIPPVDNTSPEVVLLRADSLERRESTAASPTSHARSHSDVAGVKPRKSLRHARSAVQLGSKASITNLASLFQKDVPLPDRSLLGRRTPSVDARPLVADAFKNADGIIARGPSPVPAALRPSGDGPSTWKPPSTWGGAAQARSVSPAPERPQRSLSRIPSAILSMGGSVTRPTLEVPSSSRPLSRSSSASAVSLQLTPSPASAKRESAPSPIIERSASISRAHSPALGSNGLSKDAPSPRAVTPMLSTSAPRRTHQRSSSEKLPEGTVSMLAKRERRRAPTPTPSERAAWSSTDLPGPLPGDGTPTGIQARRAPTSTSTDRRPAPSADAPSLLAPKSILANPTSPLSTPSHSPKPSILELPESGEPAKREARRVPTPTPSSRKRSPSVAHVPVPSISQSTSQVPPSSDREVRGAPTPTLPGRSRSGSIRVPHAAPAPPLPSALKVSSRSTPTHSPNPSFDRPSDDRLRRAPTPSGSRTPSDTPNVPLPDASVLARRLRKSSISAATRSEYTASSASTDSGYESSTKRFAQPTMSSSAKLKQPSMDVPSQGGRSRTVGFVDAPPLPPKSESRGRVKAREDSPPRETRGRSRPRQVGEERSVGTRTLAYEDEPRGRDKERPSSPTRGRGRSVGRPDVDARVAPVAPSARSRSVGPARAETVARTRKRTSSLSVAPPPLPGAKLTVPKLPSRAPSPAGSIIRGRMSPFPVAAPASLTAF